MKRLIVAALLLVWLALPASGLAQDAPLTNKDVIDMTQAGLPEETILLSIQGAPAKFSTGAQDLIALQKAGVSNTVLNAMISRNNGATAAALGSAATPGVIVVPAARTAVPRVPNQPFVIDGDNRVGLKMTAHDNKYDFNKQTNLWDKVDETHVVLPGEQSQVRLGNGAVAIEVPLEGVRARPDQQIFLLRLDSERGARTALTKRTVETEALNGTTMLGGGAVGYVASSVAVNAVGALWKAARAKSQKNLSPLVPVKITEVSDIGIGGLKIFHVTPQEPLTEGEYAVLWDGEYWDFGVDMSGSAASD